MPIRVQAKATIVVLVCCSSFVMPSASKSADRRTSIGFSGGFSNSNHPPPFHVAAGTTLRMLSVSCTVEMSGDTGVVASFQSTNGWIFIPFAPPVVFSAGADQYRRIYTSTLNIDLYYDKDGEAGFDGGAGFGAKSKEMFYNCSYTALGDIEPPTR